MARKSRKAHKPLPVARYDSADYLKNEEEIVAYLKEAVREGGEDVSYVAHALGVVARARGMVRLSEETGISREGLYKALSDDGNPSFGTVMKVAKAMGLKVTFEPEHT
jgi:probable addiction module antidote protein